MFKNIGAGTKGILYTAIVILLGLLVANLPGINPQIYMLTPTITVILMMFFVTRDGYRKSGWQVLGLHKLGINKWGFSLIVPIVIQAIGYVILWLTGMGHITTANLQGVSPIVVVLATIPFILIETITFSLGEELGWRGYLLPHLQRLGTIRALLLSGFIHGCWHIPLIMFTTQYHAEGNPWLVIPLFLATLTIVGVVIGYVRMTTDSVWPAALIHTVHNAAWARFALFTEKDSEYADLLTGDTGVVQLILYTIVSFILIKKLKSRG